MSGQTGRFVADAFHQVAIRADTINKIIDDGEAFFVEFGG